MDKNQIYEILGFVKVSPYRTNTLKSIGDDIKMPSEIAKDIGIRTSQVFAALADLKKQDIVICVNEEVRKGRLYKCTPKGLEILKYL